MGRLVQGAVLLAIGALIIAIVYLEPQWLAQWVNYERVILLGGLVLCGAGLALIAYAIGFAVAEGKYTRRISSLTERVEEKKRELRDLSGALEWERRQLAAARKEVAAARDELEAKRRQLAVVSGKLGDKEKRLKKIRKVVGAS
jgi:septal ring factor EnvC (AmiA/AmiB activator)